MSAWLLPGACQRWILVSLGWHLAHAEYCAASWFSHRSKHFLQGDGSGESRTNEITFAHLYLGAWLVWQYGSGWPAQIQGLVEEAGLAGNSLFFRVMGLFFPPWFQDRNLLGVGELLGLVTGLWVLGSGAAFYQKWIPSCQTCWLNWSRSLIQTELWFKGEEQSHHLGWSERLQADKLYFLLKYHCLENVQNLGEEVIKFVFD